MEPADNCRRAAFEAVADVEPARLHDLVEAILDGASMVPGALTVESTARAGTDVSTSLEEPTTDTDPVLTQAAGVQLIYEGLRLTRTIAHDEPWTDPDSAVDGDLEILAADILVARGFYLLARTDAAGKAVQTVRTFGRDQTRRDDLEGIDPTTIDANLERDVLELAVRTGAASAGEPPSSRLLAFADDLADDVAPSFPPASECLSELDPRRSELEESTTDRATSATDP
ncbi:hypothetical protein D8Y22_17275 [Salinadaptatus halalkaliphilus]|uniref:Uncharacterized protein n=1 Tax=Salinadaptatus halalkaliphilus TaxID=2419781 RepID=A0A4S3THS1_9EURY|nr:hypothetical protein [Salinadaptatus halalkaliphilus]THE63574.1 hypothetical protein D8Y22_17275 [Salinadaptatus halalkaliphilus]